MAYLRLPEYAEIIEVGPRDGFQNIKTPIATDTKIEIIGRLAACGFKRIEAASFVHPRAVPQMADAAAVLKAVRERHADVRFVALAPNLFGAERAIENGADEITFVVSASERHNLENTRQLVDHSLAVLAQVCAIKGGRTVRLGVATAFDCPFAGPVAPERVLRVIDAALEAGVDEVVLADTIGTATPLQVERLLDGVTARYPAIPLGLHIHDTQGMGLANVVTAMAYGVSRYEAAICGLGGCPFAPGAAGNIATEDLANMLRKMGIKTGVDFAKVLEAARFTEEALGVPAAGHIMRSAVCRLGRPLDGGGGEACRDDR